MAKAPKADGSAGFDPRFSPEFQPGFDPRVHGESPAVTRAAPRASAGTVITRPPARAQDAPLGAADVEGMSDQAEPEVPPPGAASRDSGEIVDADEDEPTARWRRVNPYLAALGVVGVALVGVSLGWMGWVYSIASSPYTQQFDYLIMQFAMFGAPVLLSVGVATLVSILIVLAARWRR